MSNTILCLDVSNLLYRTFFAHKGEQDVTVAGLAHHMALTTLNKYFRQFKPNQIIACFDRTSWRKEYTKSEKSVSKRPYKGNRRQNMTPRDAAKYQSFLNHLREFENLMKDHTTIKVLADDGLEGDDLIAGVVQVHTLNENNNIVIISGDKDLIQLLGYPNVRLVDPATGKDRTLEQWNNDAEYFIFEKCLRGDLGDNVMSAYPRIRTTKIKSAYEDELKKQNLLHEKWTGVDGIEYTVKDVFKENQTLMDLREQPEEIQRKIITAVLEGENHNGKFSYFHFMKFLGKYDLKRLAEQVDNFVKMLSL